MTARRNAERLIKTDKIIAVIVLILAVLVITGIFIYLGMDSKIFASRRILMELRPELEIWLLSAEDLIKKGNDAKVQKDYYDLCSSVGSAKVKELEKSISSINQIHRSLKKTAAENLEDDSVRQTAYELSECFSRFVYKRTEYNDNISAVNHLIKKEPSSWVARLLRMRELEKLDDLTIL